MDNTVDTRKPNALDEQILALAGDYSPEEISTILQGVLSPAKVASHVQRLLKSRNWLTQAQEAQLIEGELRGILRKLKDRHFDFDNAKVQLAVLKEVSARLDKRANATEDDLNKLYGNQGRIMGQAYDIALTYIQGAFRVEIDADKWDAVKREALMHAQAELARYEVAE